MNKNRVILMVLVSCLCVSLLGCAPNRAQISRECVEQIWGMKSARIVQLLGPQVVSVKAIAVWREDGLYLLFFEQSEKKVIAFHLGDGRAGSIRNMGYADRVDDQDWRLIHTQDEGSDVELNGGVGTIRAMIDAIQSANVGEIIKDYVVHDPGSPP